MKVKELIEKLQKIEPSANVYFMQNPIEITQTMHAIDLVNYEESACILSQDETK